MNPTERYINSFGSLETLSDEQPWTIGVSQMIEYLGWGTEFLLGTSKTKLIKYIVEMSDSPELSHLSTADKLKKITKRLEALQKSNDKDEKYDSNNTGYCSVQEALRRSKYFSEDYLNIEFNIYLSLCSDNYLNKLYQGYMSFKDTGNWSTHGNGGLYQYSTGIRKMQMDNLAYNEKENLLIANELKLGGKKNKDQILKYCFLHQELERMNFIKDDSKFLLLFIGDKHEGYDFKDELRKELIYVKKQEKLEYLLNNKILDIANSLTIDSLTWGELIIFNENFIANNPTISQIEIKLLSGFNKALREKALIQ